jgi:hypothetical protein
VNVCPSEWTFTEFLLPSPGAIVEFYCADCQRILWGLYRNGGFTELQTETSIVLRISFVGVCSSQHLSTSQRKGLRTKPLLDQLYRQCKW